MLRQYRLRTSRNLLPKWAAIIALLFTAVVSFAVLVK